MPECPGVFILSDMRDGAMARIRVPGGQLSLARAAALAGIAAGYGNGALDVTNRANLQIRGLDPVRFRREAVPLLRRHGLIAREPRLDRLRNILAPALTGWHSQARLDVMPLVRTLDHELQNRPELAQLSPKFSFGIDDGSGQVTPQMADLVLTIRRAQWPEGEGDHSGPPVAQLWLGGQHSGLSVPPSRATALLLAAAAAFLYVTRERPVIRVNRVVNRASQLDADRWQAVRRHILFQLPGLACSSQLPRSEAAPAAPPRAGEVLSDQAGRAVLLVGVPVGRLAAAQLQALVHCLQTLPLPVSQPPAIRLTPWQALAVTNLPVRYVPVVLAAAQATGLTTSHAPGVPHVRACAGQEGCPRTAAVCKSTGQRLVQHLRRWQADHPDVVAFSASDSAPQYEAVIHISGCPRSCAHAGRADWLLLADPVTGLFDLYANASPRTVPPHAAIRTNLSPEAILSAEFLPALLARPLPRQ